MPSLAKSRSKAAGELETKLARYRSIRDFNVTSEPRGSGSSSHSKHRETAPPFVVQKHAATRLHYDFRLGWNGVLKSWAVAKGPSDYPGDKRLAVQVEDHPIEYGSFEGTIPKGRYGGGTVMLWDFGDWTPLDDVDRGLADGHLKFELHGSKLKGRWALVRMKSRADRDDKPNWLLIKDRDQFARDEDKPSITDRAANSALSKRTMDQIARDNDRVWQSNRAQVPQPDTVTVHSNGSHPSRSARSRGQAAKILNPLAPTESFPGFIEPQLARQSTAPPSGADWVHELKLDGYRIQIQVHRNGRATSGSPQVRLLTRMGLDWTTRMPAIAYAAERLHMHSAILDGEIVVLDDKGASSFASLQSAFQEGHLVALSYFAFDLLHLDGRNLRTLPLLQRKDMLAQVASGMADNSPLKLSEHFAGDGKEVFKKACALGAEGIVSKLTSAPYISGRSNAWLKSKCIQEQEFVIGGFTEPAKGAHGVGALILGYYDAGKLVYAGRSGTGFTQKIHKSLRFQLNKLVQSKSSFADVPGGASRDVHWVKPELVAQISFATWTRGNLLRQAAFKGLREDKPAEEVVREVPISPANSSARPATARSIPRVQSKRTIAPKTALPLTHPDKVLDSESGMTKSELASYYLAVAEHILPHIADRPLSVVRCPEGNAKPCFFQKHKGLGLPPGVTSIPVTNRKTGKVEDFLTLSTPEGLVGLAQMGVLEIHPWGSRSNHLDKPDRIIFDLDPGPAIDWKTLANTAILLRRRLQDLNLDSYLKLTGGKGLHVVIPTRPEHEWAVVKEFAHQLVLGLEKQQPDLFITRMTKALRKNHIYLDYLRNDRESTAVAPFSPRARSGAPIAMPLEWRELNSKSMAVFAVSDLQKWQSRLTRDPWASMANSNQKLSAKAIRAVRLQPFGLSG